MYGVDSLRAGGAVLTARAKCQRRKVDTHVTSEGCLFYFSMRIHELIILSLLFVFLSFVGFDVSVPVHVSHFLAAEPDTESV